MNHNEITTVLAATHALPVRAMSDLQTIGTAIAASGMFGINNAASGLVVAATCHQQGITLLDFTRTYHIIQGRPSMRADAMLAEFRKRGGTYNIVCNTVERAEAVFSVDGNEYTGVYTIDDAKRTCDCYKADNKTLKDNWAKRPDDMLWARMVSRSVRRLCPEIVAGLYTPEEVQDFDNGSATKPHVISADDVATRINNAVPVQAEAVQDAPYDDDVCPTGGPEYEGKRWAELPTDVLKAAFASTLPEITDDHKERIAIVLDARGDK